MSELTNLLNTVNNPFSAKEINMLLQALNSVNVQGTDNIKAVADLARKLEAQLEHNKVNELNENTRKS